MLTEVWRIELLGGLRARLGPHTLTRFATYKAGALLAYLAYFPQRPHPREALAEQLWPDALPSAGRLSLRVALNSLRRQLEPPGVPTGSVLLTTASTVQINP